MLKYIKHGILYYWYTGNKKIAIAGATIGSLINMFIIYFTIGTEAIAIVFMLLMDHLLIVFLLLYVVFIRDYAYFESLKDDVDGLFMKSILFFIIGLVINRFTTNLIAEKYFQYDIVKDKECT